jgi:hypothetical protein
MTTVAHVQLPLRLACLAAMLPACLLSTHPMRLRDDV